MQTLSSEEHVYGCNLVGSSRKQARLHQTTNCKTLPLRAFPYHLLLDQANDANVRIKPGLQHGHSTPSKLLPVDCSYMFSRRLRVTVTSSSP